MIDFDFVSPTKIFFGRGKEAKAGEILRSYGANNVLIVYGSDRVRMSGLLGTVEASILSNGISYRELNGIRPNPTAEKVREGVALARKEEVDYVLAVGGGSVIDTAKAVSAGFFYDGDPFDFNLKKAIPQKALPIGVVLTISSAGSEASNSCVIQDDSLSIKQGFNSDLIRPQFAIENPELTFSVPPYQTFAGISDIMMHSLERYFDPGDDDELADDWALDLVKSCVKMAKRLQADPSDYQARARIMLNSTLSHNGLTGLGKKFFFVVHPLEHALSGYAPKVTHGAGVALIFPAWAKYTIKQNEAKLAKMGSVVFDINADNDAEAAIISVESIREFFLSIGMPGSLNELGLTKKDIEPLANLASGNGTRVIGCYPQSLGKQDIEAIFLSLLAD